MHDEDLVRIPPNHTSDSLLAYIDLDGNITQSSRPVQGSFLERFTERDRDRVRSILLTCAFSSRSVRIDATDHLDRSGWLELIPVGTDGGVLAVWMPSHPILPTATPMHVPRRVLPSHGTATPSPSPTERVGPRPESSRTPQPRLRKRAPAPEKVVNNFVIVADPELRDIAGRMRRALDTFADSVTLHFVPDLSASIHRSATMTKVIVLGNSRYTKFLRQLIGEPEWSLEGVSWGVRGRRAAIWYQYQGLMEPRTEPLQAELETIRLELGRGWESDKDDPREVAQAFLADFQATDTGRISSNWPTKLAYTLAVARFLVEGLPTLVGWSSGARRVWKD